MRRYLGACGILALLSAAAIVAQAALLGRIVSGCIPRARGARHADAPARRPRRRLRRPRPPRLGVRERRRAHCRDDARDSARARPRAARAGASRRAGRAAGRRGRRCRARRRRLARAVLRAVPAAARARDGRPARAARLGRAARHHLGDRARLHGAADPDLRDPDRQGDPARDDAPLAGALPAVDALRRRRTGPADAARVPARRRADRVDRDLHRRLPARHHVDAADRVPVRVRARARRVARHCGRRRRARDQARQRQRGALERVRDPRARAGALRAVAHRRRRSSTRAPTGSPRRAACSS